MSEIYLHCKCSHYRWLLLSNNQCNYCTTKIVSYASANNSNRYQFVIFFYVIQE